MDGVCHSSSDSVYRFEHVFHSKWLENNKYNADPMEMTGWVQKLAVFTLLVYLNDSKMALGKIDF